MQIGLHEVGLSLSAAQEARRALRRAGWIVLVIPIRYREANVTHERAKELARRYCEEHRLVAPVYGELEDGQVTAAYCGFVRHNLQAQARGMEPGRRTIEIDRVDGHVWTPDDTRRFSRLQGTPASGT